MLLTSAHDGAAAAGARAAGGGLKWCRAARRRRPAAPNVCFSAAPLDQRLPLLLRRVPCDIAQRAACSSPQPVCRVERGADPTGRRWHVQQACGGGRPIAISRAARLPDCEPGGALLHPPCAGFRKYAKQPPSPALAPHHAPRAALSARKPTDHDAFSPGAPLIPIAGARSDSTLHLPPARCALLLRLGSSQLAWLSASSCLRPNSMGHPPARAEHCAPRASVECSERLSPDNASQPERPRLAPAPL